MAGGAAGSVCCDRCVSLAAPVRSGDPGLAGAAGPVTADSLTADPAAAGPPASPAPSLSPAVPGAAIGSAERASKRRWLKAAVFADAGQPQDPAGDDDPVSFADSSRLPRTVTGTIEDISPHVLILRDDARERRFSLPADAVAWRGAAVDPVALKTGDHAVVRLRPSGRNVADRIWANIGRVTGIIMDQAGETILVDEGATRPPQVVVLQPSTRGRILVRFPNLEPGYLIDVIGLRRGDEMVALVPATSQPAYPAYRLPAPPLVSGRVPDAISGSATWHEPRDEPAGVLGVSYPALDPEAGCAEDSATSIRQGVTRMPYLAIGSVLHIKNDCTATDCLVPVTGCAPIARLFNDRCVTCGTSPRARVADLTLASFIALGGELERGCFNATITIGQ